MPDLAMRVHDWSTATSPIPCFAGHYRSSISTWSSAP